MKNPQNGDEVFGQETIWAKSTSDHADSTPISLATDRFHHRSQDRRQSDASRQSRATEKYSWSVKRLQRPVVRLSACVVVAASRFEFVFCCWLTRWFHPIEGHHAQVLFHTCGRKIGIHPLMPRNSGYLEPSSSSGDHCDTFRLSGYR